MRINRTRGVGAVICALAMMIYMSAFALTAAADTAESGDLTLSCNNGDVVIAGMDWDLYRIGGRTETGGFAFEGDFAACTVDLNGLAASEAQEAANDIEEFAAANGISALLSGVTDDDGALVFSGLEKGLYLLSGEELVIDGEVCEPAASIIEIKADENGSLDLTVYPKFEIRSSADSSYPDSDTDSDSSDTNSTGGGKTDSSTDSEKERLPQTGQLWWPVPILSLSGIVLIALGWRLRSKKESDE